MDNIRSDAKICPVDARRYCNCTVTRDDYAYWSSDNFSHYTHSVLSGGDLVPNAPMGACGTGLSFGWPCALARCLSNAQNALVKRHLTAPANKARPFEVNPFLGAWGDQLKTTYFQKLTCELEGQWRVGKGYSKVQQIDHSETYDTLARHRVKAFVKHEVGPKIPKKARLIQAHLNERTAYEFPWEYQAFGKTMKAVSTFNMQLQGVDFELHYAGGYNHDQMSDIVSAWIESMDHTTLIDERDGVNWDSTMQEPTLMAEAEIYQRLGMECAEVFIDRCKRIVGVVTYKVDGVMVKLRYQSSWTRLSGDWNTSCGNTIISMLICVNTILGLPPHMRPSKVKAIFMGDDYLGFYWFSQQVDPKLLKQALNEGEANYGITPERGLFRDPNLVYFISMGLWPRFEGGYQFVPKPAFQLNKLFWSVKRVTPKYVPGYCDEIAVAFLPVYYGFGMMMEFIKRHRHPQSPRKLAFKPVIFMMGEYPKKARGVDWKTGFVYKYQLPYAATCFDWPCVTGGGVLRHPLVEEMLRLEQLDPAERAGCLS